jgi:hypothetical protein
MIAEVIKMSALLGSCQKCAESVPKVCHFLEMGHLSIVLAATNIATRSACGDFAVCALSSKSSFFSFDIFLAISGARKRRLALLVA